MAALIIVSSIAALMFKVFDHPQSDTDMPTNHQACLLIVLLILGSPVLLAIKFIKCFARHIWNIVNISL